MRVLEIIHPQWFVVTNLFPDEATHQGVFRIWLYVLQVWYFPPMFGINLSCGFTKEVYHIYSAPASTLMCGFIVILYVCVCMYDKDLFVPLCLAC